MANEQESARSCPVPSRNVLLLLALTLGVMGTQLVLPGSGGRLALADVAVGASMLALLAYLWKARAEVDIPAPLPVVLIVYALANFAARSYVSGAVEVAQRVEFLFCGVLVLGLLLKYRPQWAAKAVAAALGASLLVALVQGYRYGFGSIIPPRDVTELPMGFGRAFTGLFRSRIALGLFVGLAVAWLQPFACEVPRSWKCWTGMMVATAVALGFIAHGQILVLVGAVLVVFGFIHSRKAGLMNLGALLLLSLSLLVGGRGGVLAASLNPLADKYGVLKPGHLEMIPAFRLANDHPLSGVGAGSAYQKHVGAAYKLLPRENVNDMEADSQSGYGILFATVGYPAGALLVALLLWGVGLGIRGYFVGGSEPFRLGGSAVLAIILAAMWITDPFTKGTAWFVALGLASVWSAGAVFALNLKRLIIWGAVFGALAGLVVVAGKAPTSPPSLPKPKPPTGEKGGWSSEAFSSQGFLRVIDAGDAVQVAAPMVKESDSQAAKGTVLHIPDKTCVPPNEGAADLKYGGAVFETDVPDEVTCKIWLRVWWDGSCGNTVLVRVGEEGKAMRVGDDGTYDAWHWMSAPDVVKLAKGKNKIFLLNREDGIRFDQMLITDDMDYYPQGIEENEAE